VDFETPSRCRQGQVPSLPLEIDISGPKYSRHG